MLIILLYLAWLAVADMIIITLTTTIYHNNSQVQDMQSKQILATDCVMRACGSAERDGAHVTHLTHPTEHLTNTDISQVDLCNCFL